MNEERIQAYLNLIQQLLTCPSGEENRVLCAWGAFWVAEKVIKKRRSRSKSDS